MDVSTLPKAVLVTGSSGFLAAWAINALLAAGVRVTGFDLAEDRRRLAMLVGDQAARGTDWIQGDLTDAAAVRDAVARSGCDAVLHLAALTIPACREDPVRGAKVDVIGHIHVLEAAQRAGISRVVYTSSIAVHPRGPLAAPANLYGVYKKACEDISKVWWQDHGLASIGLRPNIVYGFGRDVGETAVITEAMRAAALGKRYRLPWRGAACLQYAEDVAEIILRCLSAQPERPIVSDLSTETTRIEDVVEAIYAEVPGARIEVAASERPAPSIAFDAAPLDDLIGPLPCTPLAEGVRRTIEACRRHAAGA